VVCADIYYFACKKILVDEGGVGECECADHFVHSGFECYIDELADDGFDLAFCIGAFDDCVAWVGGCAAIDGDGGL